MDFSRLIIKLNLFPGDKLQQVIRDGLLEKSRINLEIVQRGGRGSRPCPNFFGVEFHKQIRYFSNSIGENKQMLFIVLGIHIPLKDFANIQEL